MSKVTKPSSGLNLDSGYENMPEGDYPFSLNAVIETREGNLGNISNEEGNSFFLVLPENFKIIGHLYIGGGETAVFLHNPTLSLDQIGVVYGNGDYQIFIEADFSFSLLHLIDSTFRLRRGCERVLYFTDGNSPLRSINLDNLSKNKDALGNWDISSFNLIPTVSENIKIQNIEIEDGEGNIEIGSYYFGVLQLDENLNPTEVLNTTETVKIYRGSLKNNFIDINGSLPYSEESSLNLTSKSIKFDIEGLDKTFPYYKVVIVSYTSGTGVISKVLYTDPISINSPTFIFTGKEGTTETTLESSSTLQTRFESVQHIEQIENRLVLANIKRKEVNFCKLQSFASKIKVDAVLKTVNFSNVEAQNNPKRGSISNESTGYMPGELESFGIEYYFEDGEVSPVYHIPGKASGYPSNMGTDGATSQIYQERSSCDKPSLSYWGVDSTGIPLVNKSVRHHRIPERSSFVGITFVDKLLADTVSTGKTDTITLEVKGLMSLPEEDYTVLVSWEEDSILDSVSFLLNKTSYNTKENSLFTVKEGLTGNITNITVQLTDAILVAPVYFPVDENYTPSFTTSLQEVGEDFKILDQDSFEGDIIGLEFSNIDLPPSSILGGNVITGYRIVRQEKKEADRTVVDSAVVLPLTSEENEVVFSFPSPLANPQALTAKIVTDAFALVIPKHLFLDARDRSFTKIFKTGYLSSSEIVSRDPLRIFYEDVEDGTSANDDTKNEDKDEDGFDMRGHISLSNLTHIPVTTSLVTENIKSVKFLDPLEETSYTNSSGDVKKLKNLSFDNMIAVVILNTALDQENLDILYEHPIVVSLRKTPVNPYSNFSSSSYTKEHLNIGNLSSIEVFNGGVYTSSMKYFTTSLYQYRIFEREQKSGIGRIISGALLTAGGIAATVLAVIFTGGLAAGAGVAITQAGVRLTSKGINANKRKRAMDSSYISGDPNKSMKGLTGYTLYYELDPRDDEVQYHASILTDLWFESEVNINLRYNFEGIATDSTTFLPSPGALDYSVYRDYFTRKVTVFDENRKDNKRHLAETPLEVTAINPDYLQKSDFRINFPLSETYSCCSDCNESFPHRIRWSEQSYQEEVSDNFNVFKENNYKDIEGFTGEITNLFRIQNNLYVHTEEALWHLPQNFQERITEDLVSFIGTGEYFSIPPRMILDTSNGISAGSSHKWATLKTPQGVFFVSEYLGVVYLFNGKDLKPLTNQGIYTWAKNNIKLLCNEEHKKIYKKDYEYLNNTLLSLGGGFTTTYDSFYERFIITKKDFSFKETENICTKDGVSYFSSLNIQEEIDEQQLLGWYYLGIVDCEMYFEKVVLSIEGVESLQNLSIPLPETSPLINNNSLTLSYSFKSSRWTSFHSYLPSLYFYVPKRFFSFQGDLNSVWEHNKKDTYNNFYGELKPFIIEYVSLEKLLQTKIWDFIQFQTKAQKASLSSPVEERFTTFNKALFYNSRQCSGILNLVVKDSGLPEDYLFDQVKDIAADEIVIDRNEKDWSLNELRYIRTDYTSSVFSKDLSDLQLKYFIDKVVNQKSLDLNKDWQDLECFRDKYLVVRLIFDKFDNVNLTLNFSIENSEDSPR